MQTSFSGLTVAYRAALLGAHHASIFGDAPEYKNPRYTAGMNFLEQLDTLLDGQASLSND
jgi:hypothetical protein